MMFSFLPKKCAFYLKKKCAFYLKKKNVHFFLNLILCLFLKHVSPSKIILMVFSFLPKNVHFISKNAISCLILENVSPSKMVICFILNNLHFSMVEGIAFYALHKSRVLVIPCKSDDFCLFIGLPDEI